MKVTLNIPLKNSAVYAYLGGAKYRIRPMVKAILLVLLFATMCVSQSFAGFIVKKQAPATAAVTAVHVAEKRPLLAAIMPRHLAELPKGVYIALCILPLGWLAIAINENFTQQTWIFSLLLYLLLYVPGLIYSLRQMRNYYR